MGKLVIKPKSECRWDAAALGEIMIRLDPGDGRIKTTRTFTAWEGGGEYNVVRGLKRCFGLDTTVATAIADNDVGYLLQDLIYQGGVDQTFVKWMPFDGIGRNTRVGLNFTEKGFGIRGALGVSDRANSAASQLKVGDIDWNKLFKEEGVRWFHSGGIFAALSDTTPELTIEAMKAAKANGTITSYDLNFRPSLWRAIGGTERAVEVNREIAKYVDVMIGNEEDFTAALGFKVEGVTEHVTGINVDNFKNMIKQVVKKFPNFKAVGNTLREVHTASINDWSAILYYDGEFYQARQMDRLEIYDRVGGGDSFASGLIYGFLSGKDPAQIIDYGAVHGALAMTTPGDTTMASLKELERIIAGGSARVDR